jgi:hypothetical protein
MEMKVEEGIIRKIYPKQGGKIINAGIALKVKY